MGANAPGRVANAVMRRRSMTAAEAALPSSISADGEARSRRDRCSDGIDVLNGAAAGDARGESRPGRGWRCVAVEWRPGRAEGKRESGRLQLITAGNGCHTRRTPIVLKVWAATTN